MNTKSSDHHCHNHSIITSHKVSIGKNIITKSLLGRRRQWHAKKHHSSMQGLNASGQMITTQQLAHSLLVGWGRGRRVEVRTLVGWDKDSMQTEQNNEFFNYFTSAGRYLATSFSLPSFYFQEYHHMAQDIFLVSGVSCPSCVPPNFWEPPACLLSQQCEKQKEPQHWVNTAPQQLKHQHGISAVFITNLKHNLIPG